MRRTRSRAVGAVGAVGVGMTRRAWNRRGWAAAGPARSGGALGGRGLRAESAAETMAALVEPASVTTGERAEAGLSDRSRARSRSTFTFRSRVGADSEADSVEERAAAVGAMARTGTARTIRSAPSA